MSDENEMYYGNKIYLKKLFEKFKWHVCLGSFRGGRGAKSNLKTIYNYNVKCKNISK